MAPVYDLLEATGDDTPVAFAYEEFFKEYVDRLDVGGEDTEAIKTLQGWLGEKQPVLTRILVAAKVVARVASKALDDHDPMCFLDILMHEHFDTINEWKGEGESPPILAIPSRTLGAVKEWYKKVKNRTFNRMQKLMGESKKGLRKNVQSYDNLTKYIRHGRTNYKRVRHHMKATSSKEDVHEVFMACFSDVMGIEALESKVKGHCHSLHQERFPLLYDANGTRVTLRPRNGKAGKKITGSAAKGSGRKAKRKAAKKTTGSAAKGSGRKATCRKGQTAAKPEKRASSSKAAKGQTAETSVTRAAKAKANKEEAESKTEESSDDEGEEADPPRARSKAAKGQTAETSVARAAKAKANKEEAESKTEESSEDEGEEAVPPRAMNEECTTFEAPNEVWIKQRNVDMMLLQQFLNGLWVERASLDEPNSLYWDLFGARLQLDSHFCKSKGNPEHRRWLQSHGLLVVMGMELEGLDHAGKTEVETINWKIFGVSVATWNKAYMKDVKDVLLHLGTYGRLLSSKWTTKEPQNNLYRRVVDKYIIPTKKKRLLFLMAQILHMYYTRGHKALENQSGKPIMEKDDLWGALEHCFDEGFGDPVSYTTEDGTAMPEEDEGLSYTTEDGTSMPEEDEGLHSTETRTQCQRVSNVVVDPIASSIFLKLTKIGKGALVEDLDGSWPNSGRRTPSSTASAMDLDSKLEAQPSPATTQSPFHAIKMASFTSALPTKASAESPVARLPANMTFAQKEGAPDWRGQHGGLKWSPRTLTLQRKVHTESCGIFVKDTTSSRKALVEILTGKLPLDTLYADWFTGEERGTYPLGLKDEIEGCLVVRIAENGPGFNAGIRKNDVITSLQYVSFPEGAPSTSTETVHQFADLSQESRLKLFKTYATEVKLTILRPNQDILSQMYKWIENLRTHNSKKWEDLKEGDCEASHEEDKTEGHTSNSEEEETDFKYKQNEEESKKEGELGEHKREQDSDSESSEEPPKKRPRRAIERKGGRGKNYKDVSESEQSVATETDDENESEVEGSETTEEEDFIDSAHDSQEDKDLLSSISSNDEEGDEEE